MTRRKHFKRLVRSRAAVTGESYAVALRSIRQHRPEDRMLATSPPVDQPFAYCSFCAKPNTEVQRLVAGPGVFICDACIGLSATIVAEADHPAPEEAAQRRAQFADRSADEILGMLPAIGRLATRVEADLSRWVSRLRDQGIGWQQIADALGTSPDAARQRFEVSQPG
jgi:hypothetical protein